MDEEETVILKNSQLYSYINSAVSENGNVDGIDLPLIRRLQESEPTSRAAQKKFSVSNIYSLLRWISSCFHTTVAKLLELCFPAQDELRLKLMQQILASQLLYDDDADILRSEYENLVTSYESSTLPKWPSSCAMKIRQYRLVLGLSCGLFYYSFRSIASSGTIFYFVDALVASIIIAFGAQTISDFQHRRLLDQMKAVLHSSAEMDESLKKALKIIREYEVLARGYTVVTKYTVVANKPVKEDPEFVAPLLQLRKCVLLSAEELFDFCRRWTLEIRQSLPNTWDNTQPFLLASVDDLRSMFGDFSQRKDWKISLSILHGCCYCLYLQRSEFLRVLITSRHDQRQLRRILAQLIANTSMWIERLRGSLTCYQGRLSTAMPRNEKTHMDAPDPKYDYIHSLNLHLRLALERSLEFENFLLVDPREDQHEFNNIPNFIDELRSTLRKCQTCLDEVEQLSKVATNAGGTKGANDDSGAMNRSSAAQNPEELVGPVYDGTEREIVDQVYEAYTDSNDPGFKSLALEYDPNADSQFVSGRQHVLEELKNVLTVRSSIMRVRESKALATKRGITVEELAAEEEKELENIRKRKMEKQRKREMEDERKQEMENRSEQERQTHYVGNTSNKPFSTTTFNAAPNTLSSELMLAFQARNQHRAQEVILGDDTSSEEEMERN